MYSISDEQMEYILADIERNGIELEDLKNNLLDHICCILERHLTDGDDFKVQYERIKSQFYIKDLKEIQEETIQLLTFKNYYAMKKFMIISGIYCTIAFIVGSFFKIMYWPGAGPLLISAILVFSVVFLPITFLLKTKETHNQRNKWVLGIGTLVGMLYCISTVFLLQHWPGMRAIWLFTLAVTFFVLIPVYFLNGIRNPETKTNTIVFTIILMGILGIQFTMTAIRQSPQTNGRVYTYLQSERLLEQMKPKTDYIINPVAKEIQNTCQQLKALILTNETGLPEIPMDFETRNIQIKESNLSNGFFGKGDARSLLERLRIKVQEYNNAQSGNMKDIPVENSILDPGFLTKDFCGNLYVLNNITQIQLFLATAEG